MDSGQIFPSDLFLELLHRLPEGFGRTNIIPSSKSMACIDTYPNPRFIFHEINHRFQICECRSDDIGPCICLESAHEAYIIRGVTIFSITVITSGTSLWAWLIAFAIEAKLSSLVHAPTVDPGLSVKFGTR
jgi:hypothetical protein